MNVEGWFLIHCFWSFSILRQRILESPQSECYSGCGNAVPALQAKPITLDSGCQFADNYESPKRRWLMKRAVVLAFILLIAITLTACGGVLQAAKPQAGATYSGDIAVAADKASSATLSFKISDNGEAITSISIFLSDVHCKTMSAGSMMQTVQGNFALDGSDINIQAEKLGEIKGKFTSEAEASGTINIVLKNEIMGAVMLCELGSWDWKASTSK
jgi:hypothetical protein